MTNDGNEQRTIGQSVFEWPVTGSRGDAYTVEMKDKGFYCDCPARVKCKHIKTIENKFK